LFVFFFFATQLMYLWNNRHQIYF